MIIMYGLMQLRIYITLSRLMLLTNTNFCKTNAEFAAPAESHDGHSGKFYYTTYII